MTRVLQGSLSAFWTGDSLEIIGWVSPDNDDAHTWISGRRGEYKSLGLVEYDWLCSDQTFPVDFDTHTVNSEPLCNRLAEKLGFVFYEELESDGTTCYKARTIECVQGAYQGGCNDTA